MEKLLITGADTVVGSGLAQRLAGRFDIVGIHEQQSLELDGCRTIGCDLSDAGELTAQVLAERPQWVVHCGPLSQSSWDLSASDAAFDGQPEIARSLAQSAAEVGARLTVVSTDAVFSAPRMFHCEDDPTGQHHAAAVTAREMERAVEHAAALVVRTHAYGRNAPGSSFVDRLLQGLDAKSPIPASPHRYATPIFAGDLADLLHAAYRAALSGVYHIAGAERASQLGFARELAAAFGSSSQLATGSAADLTASIEVHEETSLSCRRAQRTLNLPMPLLREGLVRLAEQEDQKPGTRPKTKTERLQPVKTAA